MFQVSQNGMYINVPSAARYGNVVFAGMVLKEDCVVDVDLLQQTDVFLLSCDQ